MTASSPSTHSRSSPCPSSRSPSSRGPSSDPRPAPVVFGCSGPVLTPEERDFFADVKPFGFILFTRNCRSPDQVRALVDELRSIVGADIPVLIDQEGGRVQRLRGADWPDLPPMRALGRAAEADRTGAMVLARRLGRLIADQLRPLGITVNCAPVADVAAPEMTDAIGDRAFSSDPDRVAELALALAAGLLDGGVLPVVKHLPGHGRARVDSHVATPLVEADRDALEARDFRPFRALQALPCAMVAHVVHMAVDPIHPASVSKDTIATLIRREFGFDGLLFSDDIDMDALGGTMPDRARAVLEAGCDVALHCNGRMEEMEAIAAAVPAMTVMAWTRWERARLYPARVDVGVSASLSDEARAIMGALERMRDPRGAAR